MKSKLKTLAYIFSDDKVDSLAETEVANTINLTIDVDVRVLQVLEVQLWNNIHWCHHIATENQFFVHTRYIPNKTNEFGKK